MRSLAYPTSHYANAKALTRFGLLDEGSPPNVLVPRLYSCGNRTFQHGQCFGAVNARHEMEDMLYVKETETALLPLPSFMLVVTDYRPKGTALRMGCSRGREEWIWHAPDRDDSAHRTDAPCQCEPGSLPPLLLALAPRYPLGLHSSGLRSQALLCSCISDN